MFNAYEGLRVGQEDAGCSVYPTHPSYILYILVQPPTRLNQDGSDGKRMGRMAVECSTPTTECGQERGCQSQVPSDPSFLHPVHPGSTSQSLNQDGSDGKRMGRMAVECFTPTTECGKGERIPVAGSIRPIRPTSCTSWFNLPEFEPGWVGWKKDVWDTDPIKITSKTSHPQSRCTVASRTA